MANFFSFLFGGTKHDKDMKRLRPIVESVKNEYSWAESLKDEEFPEITKKWKSLSSRQIPHYSLLLFPLSVKFDLSFTIGIIFSVIQM